MTARPRFWETTSLADMTPAEWESLCDRCGLCCLVKAEDDDSGDVYDTNVICAQYDGASEQCGCYADRRTANPDCTQLTAANVQQFDWLPDSCAYRLVARGLPLPANHPLVAGSSARIPSVVERFRAEGIELIAYSDELDLEDHIVGGPICRSLRD